MEQILYDLIIHEEWIQEPVIIVSLNIFFLLFEIILPCIVFRL